ncbi:MAG TPA: protein phosphatase 2C domain-containing protein [Kofleriaceae bacterium]
MREHNEDAHFLDVELGMFLVCDGMGGHAAGEVASAIAVQSICQEWASGAVRDVAGQWLERGTPDAKKRLIDVVRAGVFAAHGAILTEARRDRTKHGMGTTLVGAMVFGGEAVFAHAGDSRAYLVRDGIAMQLTEDHTLLARLLAAGIDVDVSGEGSRFRSMLTNALGIGDEVKVSTFVVPLADGDRIMLCSDGISEYVPEAEVGEVLTAAPTPERAAERLVQLALDRGGGDNATAVVVEVVEAGVTPQPADQRKRDDAAIASCALWGKKITPQQRLRALRIASPRDHAKGDKLPPHTMGDRVAWLVVEGELVQDGQVVGPGALIYPESLVSATGKAEAPAMPDRDALAVARGEVRALAIRSDDFRELCEDDAELADGLKDGLSQLLAAKQRARLARAMAPAVDPRGATDPHLRAVEPDDAVPATPDREPGDAGDRAATAPDDPSAARPWLPVQSPTIAPVGAKPAAPAKGAPPGSPGRRVAVPVPGPATRPSPLPAQLSPRGSAPKPAPPAAMRAHPALSARPLDDKPPEATPLEIKTRKSEPRLELRPVAPVTAPRVEPVATPTPIEPANRTKPGDWDQPTERIGPPLRRPAAPTPSRAPTEPDGDAYLELEIKPEVPAEPGDDYDAVSIIVGENPALPTDDYDSVSVIVHEPESPVSAPTPAARPRRVTSDAEVISGVIEERPAAAPPPRRTKRHTRE